MDAEQARRITAYFLNSRKFLWGIGKGKKQEEVYKWLKNKGFLEPDGSAYKTNYSDVAHDMIKRYGIEKIMKDLVITPVREYYGHSIDFLRNYWREGKTPEYKDLEINGIIYEFTHYYRDSGGKEIQRYGPSFLDVNSQYKFIEGWTTWAHIFFEDIEYAFPTTQKGIERLSTEPTDESKKATDWRSKGVALRNLKRNEEALEAFNKAIELDPKNAGNWRSKGVALRNLKRNEEALEAFNKAIELDPKNASSWRLKGTALRRLKKYNEALEAVNKAIEIDPKNIDSIRLRNLVRQDLIRYT